MCIPLENASWLIVAISWAIPAGVLRVTGATPTSTEDALQHRERDDEPDTPGDGTGQSDGMP